MIPPTITLRHSADCVWKGRLRTWYELAFIAEKYGWKRSGSLPPRDDASNSPWDGDYLMPVGQIVSAEDARALGKALGLVLRATTTLILGDVRGTIERFVAFCERGQFEIWSDEEDGTVFDEDEDEDEEEVAPTFIN